MRCTALLAAVSALTFVTVDTPARADATGTGTVAVEFRYAASGSEQLEDFDGVWTRTTVVDQRATMHCPVTSYGIQPVSQLEGPSAEQQAAYAAAGEAAAAQAAAIPADTVASMENLQQQMDGCLAAGGSDEACAMQAMQAMQADPAMMNAMGAMTAGGGAMADATAGIDATAGHFQTWISEDCTGEMTVNNRITLAKGSENKLIEAVSGTRPLSGVDANVTAETDLDRQQSRYVIVAVSAEGFPRQGEGGGAVSGGLLAIPEAVVKAGPQPGPLGAGSVERDVPGGRYSVTWTFTPGP